jgi:hypothetical protein
MSFTYPQSTYQSHSPDPSISDPYPSDQEAPVDLSSYSKIMHQHTKKQMEAASRSARRRSGYQNEGTSAHATLRDERGTGGMSSESPEQSSWERSTAVDTTSSVEFVNRRWANIIEWCMEQGNFMPMRVWLHICDLEFDTSIWEWGYDLASTEIWRYDHGEAMINRPRLYRDQYHSFIVYDWQ